MPRIEITDTSIRTKCLPPAKGAVTTSNNPKVDEFYWDTRTEGLGVRAKHDGGKFFVLQRKMPGTGESVRGTLGRWGDLTLKEARDKAVVYIGKIREGVNPFKVARDAAAASLPQTWETFTLQQAIDEHIANMTAKQDAEGSKDQLRDELTVKLADWLDRPLAKISSGDCIDLHRKLSEKTVVEKGKRRGGPVLANRIMRNFRACWNSARKRHDKLPPTPTLGVTFNKQTRKRSPIPWPQMAAWAEAVDGIDNKVRADLQWCFLLTGTSGRGLKKLRWENVDFNEGTIHFPKPKGGEDKAFTIPASAWLLALLAKRQLANKAEYGDTPWVFPTRDRKGDVIATRESDHDIYESVKDESGKRRQVKRHFFQFTSAKKRTENATSHRLRDTFATACMEAGVGFTETQVLMNHSLPNGNVTQGYQRPTIEHLRACVEKTTAFLLSKAGVGVQAPVKKAPSPSLVPQNPAPRAPIRHAGRLC